MTAERRAKEVFSQYKEAASSLAGYEHYQDLDEEFQALYSLENELFEQKRILEEPSLLLNLNVKITSGETETSEGIVMGIEIDQTGSLMALVLKGHPKPILFNTETKIEPVRNN